MDLQALMDAMNAVAARERGKYQMTLGGLVGALAAADPAMRVVYDMPGARHPSAPVSYRGYYSDLSFPPSHDPITVTDLLVNARDALGATFEGYKGGDFTMTAETPLWAADYDIASGVAIMGAHVIGDNLVLITKLVD